MIYYHAMSVHQLEYFLFFVSSVELYQHAQHTMKSTSSNTFVTHLLLKTFFAGDTLGDKNYNPKMNKIYKDHTTLYDPQGSPHQTSQF
mmetsp:Transcript_24026/g.35532  ORF Transcript_24026/g.35532 Transcript_24026/m.35532 type:complete len:88 (+) Transcript_24026:751-1014(+)